MQWLRRQSSGPSGLCGRLIMPLAASAEFASDVTMPKSKPEPAMLRGWQEIASFLGLPVSTVKRWARFGMPVTREGRRVQASPEEVNRWLGREVSEPVRIANENTDLSAELKRGLSYVRKRRRTEAA